jgi:hypothetical protein
MQVNKGIYMARLRRRRVEREDIQHNHDDFYEAIPYQQSLIADDADIDDMPVARTSQAARVVYFVLAVVEVLLALRLVLKLLGANTGNAFVSAINTISYPLVRPFVGMFPATLDTVQGFSVPAAVAMLVYALIAYLIIALIRVFIPREY